jgi:DNA-binding MarR family transcriptional regulator
VAAELHLGVLMFIAYRYAENRILDAVHRAGYVDLTVAQARVAARIGPHGTRLTELAEQAQVAKQTATASVDRLERAGYVERVVDPSDARARLVRLTARSQDVLAVARAEEAAIEAEWTKHLGARRTRQLREALTLLREVADPYREPPDER